MNKNLYYGEIAAKISAHLYYQNPEQITKISRKLRKECDDTETIWTVCADAARVFDTIEDLSEEHFLDWNKALNYYADEVLGQLLKGRKPQILDMVSMAARSIENTLSKTQKQAQQPAYSI